jgi:hypothetical protein
LDELILALMIGFIQFPLMIPLGSNEVQMRLKLVSRLSFRRKKMRESKRELVLRLQKLRLEKGLSYQDILEQCEQRGEAVSISTIKRVFSKGGEASDYRYESTLLPLVHVLCEAEAEEPAAVAVEEADTLQAMVDLQVQIMAQKDRIIQETQEKLDIYKSALNSSKRLERALVIVLLVAMFVLYGMTVGVPALLASLFALSFVL